MGKFHSDMHCNNSIHNLNGKMCEILQYISFVFHTQKYQPQWQVNSFIPFHILNVFTEGFVYISCIA